MTETPGITRIHQVLTFGDDEGDDVERYEPIQFQVIAKDTGDGRVTLEFLARGMVAFRVLELEDAQRETVRAWFDQVLYDSDGIDELPDFADLDDQLDALNKIDPATLSSRMRWRWLWSEQECLEVRGGNYGKVFEALYQQYEDRHGIPRFPTGPSATSSQRHGRTTGSGSRRGRR